MKLRIYRNMLLGIALLTVAISGLAQSGNVPKPVEGTKEESQPTPQKKEIYTEEQRQQLRQQRETEEQAATLQYLKNYFEEYRLGPEDVISVEVFNLPAYSVPNLIVPPDGKVNYKLIGQINVRGRGVEDIQKEIAEKLNEYIIDPKVTVQLVQSHSMKFLIDGDVARPAVYEMTRRMTIREVLINAGGILPTGDKTKVVISRSLPNGTSTVIPINYRELEKGRGLDEAIAPGDMIFVPGNRFKTFQKWTQVLSSVTTLPLIFRR